jgi:hypothetical protein
VPVHVLGDRDAGVAKHLGDDMKRCALGEHQRGTRVPQLVRMLVTQPSRLVQSGKCV